MTETACKVLVVEDDLLIATDLAFMVKQAGCLVIGPIGTVSKALSAARQNDLGGAVLDISLHGDNVWPLAENLERHGVPFLLVSGYSYTDVPERFWHVPLLAKPITSAELRQALLDLGRIHE